MIKFNAKHFIVLVISVLSCLFWVVGNRIDPDSSYSLFFFRPEKSQKLHWYFHISSFYISSICVFWVLFDLTKSLLDKNHKLILKILICFELYKLVEYWSYRYETPIVALTACIIISIAYLFRRGF